MNNAQPTIVLAAGGTGGHIFPAEALARELLGRGYEVALMTDKRGLSFSEGLTVPVYRIRSSALGKGLIGKIRSVGEIGFGFLQAWSKLAKIKPKAVIGFGGYPTVPILYAAAQCRIPFVLHEQNAIVGRANAVFAGRASALATSFPEIKGLPVHVKTRTVYTGNPVRPAFMALRAKPYATPQDGGAFKLLVLGGSLGARIFSQVVPQAIARLPETMRRRLVVSQQCRKEDIDVARSAYAAAGVETELSTFFHDVPERMADAHLVIGRSGGSTIAELTVIGRPSILIPFAGGIAGEQTANAEAVAEAGGAWLIPEQAFTPESLAIRLESLIALPSSLSKTAAAARAWGKVRAVDNLADCIVSIITQGENLEHTS